MITRAVEGARVARLSEAGFRRPTSRTAFLESFRRPNFVMEAVTLSSLPGITRSVMRSRIEQASMYVDWSRKRRCHCAESLTSAAKGTRPSARMVAAMEGRPKRKSGSLAVVQDDPPLGGGRSSHH